MATTTSDTLLEDLSIPHERNVPLGPLTWYGLGGSAEYLAHPSSVQQLSALAARCHETDTPVYVLGSGANLLVADRGVRGVVVQLDDPCFKQIKIEGTRVTSGAGYDLAKLVLDTARAGLAGLECLAGIPASVGGAVRMNAGGAFGCIGNAVRRVMVCDARGQVYYRSRDDLEFGYRRTNIVARYILDIEFELSPSGADGLMQRVKEIFRLKKSSQPLAEHSAGCVFKNPPPTPCSESEEPPPTAGQLIDRAGLKALRVGGAEVSSRHANFVVAHPGCTADDVLTLVGRVQSRVADRFGVKLEREIVVWP